MIYYLFCSSRNGQKHRQIGFWVPLTLAILLVHLLLATLQTGLDQSVCYQLQLVELPLQISLFHCWHLAALST